MSKINKYRIVGYFKDSKGEKVDFSREIKASSKKRAVKSVKQIVGSQHRVKAHLITVTSTETTED